MRNINLSFIYGKINEKIRYKIWIVGTMFLCVAAFGLFAAITAYIDPLFHYHAPLEQYGYPIYDERYQNDGIMRNFEYDAVITGTSMVENFKTSEANKIFDADFIKVPFSGECYKLINDNLERGYDAGKNIRYIIRCLDYSLLVQDKDSYRYEEYPTYLYNNNLFDDLNYVLNKEIFFKRTRSVVEYTRNGNLTTSFDAYVNWNSSHTFGAETVLSTYTLDEKATVIQELKKEDKIMMLENIRQNVMELAEEHPETTFYLFFPPYSICYWDCLNNSGQIDWCIDAEELAIEELLKVSNIKLYSFSNNFELVCNLDNYKDRIHYGEWVNSWILEWLHNGDYLLTKDNYHEYIQTIREFYNSYDYASLHE